MTTSFENSVRVLRSSRTIEVTKGFDKASRRFGTAALRGGAAPVPDPGEQFPQPRPPHPGERRPRGAGFLLRLPPPGRRIRVRVL